MVHSNTALRAFGRAEDLDLDFRSSDRPSLITALLARCAEPPDPKFWWGQPVGSRIAVLLRLLLLTDGTDCVTLQSRCRRPECAQLFEFNLPLTELIDQPADDTPF